MEKDKKTCKYCKMEIPKEAKICPNCRKKQGGKMKWIILVVVGLLGVGVLAGGGDDKPKKVADADTSTADNAEADTAEVEEKETFGIGETAELNDVQVTMLSYSESAGSEFNYPSEGNEFLLVEFEIVNNSDSEMNISSMMSFDAYADDYALNYSLSALMENESANQLDGTIAGGKRMKGMIGYEVPADWSTVEIHFTDNVWSNNQFKFEITR